MLYLGIFLVAALVAYSARRSPGAAKALYPLLLGLLFLFAAFRFEVGCDWTGYLNQFHYDQAFDQLDTISRARDPLWWWYVRLLRNTGVPYPWLNLVPTAIFFAGVHVLARRQPNRFAFLTLLWPILIINVAMSGVRQAAAIGILCVAFNAFVERKAIRFAALVLLASTIHSSAMVFILLVPLVNGGYSGGRIALAALLAVPGAALMINSAAGEVALSRYVDAGTDAAGAAFRVGLLALSGIAFFVLLRRPWLKTGAGDYRLVSIGSLGMIALAALLPLSTVIADRLGFYFVPIQAVIFARIPFLPLGRFKSFYALTTYVALGVTLTVWVLFSAHYAQCYTPYRTWLLGMPESRYGI